MMNDSIIIKGARENNLKDIDVTIPRNKLTVITGLSGSGKSTLAFDTIYAEGQRRYVESLSSYARQFLGQMNKPDVDSIEGLSPAISIDQKTTSKNPRSTVGTITEIYDYLRLLFARVGEANCPVHNIRIASQTPERIVEQVLVDFKDEVIVLSPIVRQKKGTYDKLITDLNKDGYVRARVNGEIVRTDEKVSLGRYDKHDIEAVIDRVNINDSSRLIEAISNAVRISEDGLVIITNEAKQDKIYSSKMACPVCGLSFEELQPRMFSFNSPFGACDDCSGLGFKMEFDPDLIIPNKSKSIAEGAIELYRNAVDGWRGHVIAAVAKRLKFSLMDPVSKLNQKQFDGLMYGVDSVNYWGGDNNWEGLVNQSERLFKQTESDYRRRELGKFMRTLTCPKCNGKRLKDKVLAVTINGKSIIDVSNLPINDCIKFFNELKLSDKNAVIAKQILKEINSRLNFLNSVGLTYLTLSRPAATLSGGESQRIRLATQIGSNLTGVLYILDEPSIGLHQRDNQKLIGTLKQLRDLGNTLIVVEHDEETIRSADHIIDIGPRAGVYGGQIVAQGLVRDLVMSDKSITGKYLSGAYTIDVPENRRPSNSFIRINGARANNLKNINVNIPLGVMTVITGVSGSGKSTLIHETLYKTLMKQVYKSRVEPGIHDSLTCDKLIDKVIVIDQSPIGKTPRSNPATYTKVFDEIRRVFALTKDAKLLGFKEGRFSFNVKGGRCEACHGDGLIKIEMNFLPDVFVECEECKGKRYNNETLRVKYKDKSIADVLNMSVLESLEFFDNIPFIKRKLSTLKKVGLGYLKLGQSSTNLSGGEAQRIKLTRELSKRPTGQTIYLLDEPTTGLHFHDVKKLIHVLDSLVSKGNTVIVIEHNLDVIKSADHLIDLGPDGGDKGGYVVASGTPEQVALNEHSYTGQFLKKMLKN
ncbi:MAG: excinuclease ABC subunit UvrA [Candidatus Nanoarchaeia archaeon]|jgi:excinuclease ABC subunit A